MSQSFILQADGSYSLQVTGGTGGGTGTGAQQVQGNSASGTTTATNPVVVGGQVQSSPSVTPGTQADGVKSNVLLNPNGMVYVSVGDYSGGAGNDGRANLYGFSGRTGASIQPSPVAVGGFFFNGTTWDRQKKPSLTSRIVASAASTNATSAKGSSGDLFCVTGYNSNAATRYLKIYNKATAPTVGTDTPIKTIALPPSSGFAIDYASSPYYFSTGIAYALTTGSADSDTGAVGANDILGLNLDYQ